MVFQSYALFPHMSVFENVAFGLRVKRVSRDDVRTRVADALRSVRLEGMEERKPGQLSGGQQQRVALARALVNEPAALLLDEPLGALDLKLRQEMQLELKEIQSRTRTTFVYVTHDQEEALTMSDRIAVMNGGLVEQIAAPRELYEHPATAFVAGFIGTSNLLALRVDSGRRRPRRHEPRRGRAPARPLRRAAAGETVQITVRPGEDQARRAGGGERAGSRARNGRRGRLPRLDDAGHRRSADGRAPRGAPPERPARRRRGAGGRPHRAALGRRAQLRHPAPPALAGSGTNTEGEPA